MTEDEVVQQAKVLLRLDDGEDAISGIGQNTTFKDLSERLGVKSVWKDYYNYKPDGWYFPLDPNGTAILLEAKSSKKDISKNDEIEKQLIKYIDAATKRYAKAVGIIYNGEEVKIYDENGKQIREAKTEKLLSKEYYISLVNRKPIDIDTIQTCTIRINELLHHKIIMQDLRHRMIFTACALVAHRKGANLQDFKGLGFNYLKSRVIETIKANYTNEERINDKLKVVEEQYEKITCDKETDTTALSEFIDNVVQISNFLGSEDWNGADVMAIFFNEFNRYLPKKPDYGQVFTPDHIVSFMYKIAGVTCKSKVLDACCGSGAFLVNAMSEMITEVGGATQKEAVKEICNNHLFGVELSKDLYTLACANMLIHKDGKTNIIQKDARETETCEWIKSKNIDKVLMNPPYENKYGVYKIVENVLDSVVQGATCAFLLPDNKLEIGRKQVEKWLKRHRLDKIIKLPDIFAGKASASVSLFVFTAHEPQDNKPIYTCWIQDDGLETVKNKGRQDVKGIWRNKKEPFWLDFIYKYTVKDGVSRWQSANDALCYKMPEPKFEITEKNFKKTVLDFMLFEEGIDKKEFEQTMLDAVLYGSQINANGDRISIDLDGKDE